MMPSFLRKNKVNAPTLTSNPAASPPPVGGGGGIPSSISLPTGFQHVAHIGTGAKGNEGWDHRGPGAGEGYNSAAGSNFIPRDLDAHYARPRSPSQPTTSTDYYSASTSAAYSEPALSHHQAFSSHSSRRPSSNRSQRSSDASALSEDVLYNGRSSSGGSRTTIDSRSSYQQRPKSSGSQHAMASSSHVLPPPPQPIKADEYSNRALAQGLVNGLAISEPARGTTPVPSHVPAPAMAQNFSSQTQLTATMSPNPSMTSSLARKTSSRYALNDFIFMRTLGTGSFGRVHLVRSRHNTRYYAVKVLAKERVVKMKQVEHTNSEREMLERVRNPFLVNLWGTFKDARNLYMVMDFISGGELFSLLRKSQRFPDPVAKFFAAEVALALDYLHSLDIIYRDLKPENILLAADGHIRLTDFGFARYCPDITWTLCGTPDYLAPEIVQSRGYNKSVDWYALGVLIFEMLSGYPPFFSEDSNPMRLYEKIIAGKVRYPSHFGPTAKDLVRNLLVSDLTKRFGNLANGSRDIFAHTWFAEVDWDRLYRKEIPAPYVPHTEGDGDVRHFDQYAEIDVEAEYGQPGPDPHGHLFPLF